MTTPNPLADRFRGHARPAKDLLMTRPNGSRRVYVGLADCGYVRLTPDECVAAAAALLALAGRDAPPGPPV